MKKYLTTILRLWKLLKPFHKHFYIQLGFIVVTQLTSILIVYTMSNILNNIVSKEFLLAIYFVLGWFFMSVLNSYLNYFIGLHEIKNLNQYIQQYLQEDSFKKIFNLNISQYIEDHSAVKYEVISRGENSISEIINTIFLNVLPTVFQVLFSLVAIYLYSPLISLICALTFLIVIFWTNHFSNYHRPFVKENMNNWDEQKKVRMEAFQHLNLIRTNASENKYLESYLNNRTRVVDYFYFTWKKNYIHMNKRRIFFHTSRLIVFIEAIKEFALGKLEIGGIYAIWAWLNDVFSNIGTLTQAMRHIPLRFVELEKYLDIIDKKPEFDENGKKDEKIFKNGNIVFENVSFKYPKGENDVIENLNIEIPQGKKVAFVGFSGSGKSTIIKLLLRVYDWKDGDIKIGNVSLRDMDAKVLRKNIGYVEQHVDLFDSSIEENILFGIENKDIDKNILDEIIHKSRIDQFFHRLGEKGLDTVIGERGVKLSGGERQRIGIARALIKNPEILIFDEATASLDTENEKYIQEAIDESSKGRTTIIIAHRLSTVQNADIIFVMDKGKIVAEGKHEELKDNNEEYQRLIKAQEH